MGEPPEFWMFTVANTLVFVFGGLLTALSYYAYRARASSPSFRNATLGFAFVTAGGMVEPTYQLGIRGSYQLSGREMLAMQAVDGGLMATGLALLFWAIAGYQRSSERGNVTISLDSDEL